MIVEFKAEKNLENVGNKAKNLIEMKANGFNVPDGFVVDSETYLNEIVFNKIDNDINNYLKKLSIENVEEISKEISSLFDGFEFSKKVKEEIISKLKDNKLYAVRSSGMKEDLEEYSFAGQYETYLNTKKRSVLKRIIDCYKSMFSKTILSYIINNNISTESLKMSVIVQEMVPSTYSGICFTVDPVSGNDKTMLIEVGEGLGENIVSGQNKPEQYYYNWYDEKVKENENTYLNDHLVKKKGTTFSSNSF